MSQNDGPSSVGSTGPAGPGEPVVVATFRAVHEAELAKSHLASEGIEAEVWDANLISADPLLAIAIRGVKVVTRAPDAARAKALLDPILSEFEGPRAPVFRVIGTRAGTGLLFGAGLGLVSGFGLERALGSPALFAAALGGGAIIGVMLGMMRRADTCSEPSCGGALPQDAVRCPKCGGTLRGTIAHANQRLAAEEELPDYAPSELPEDDEGDEREDDEREDGKLEDDERGDSGAGRGTKP
jgi:hypothetical protein